MERKQIKDFKVALKDLEPFVKDPAWLHNGRDISNFKMRPREAWPNWLLCVVLREAKVKNITFAEDDQGDGVLIDLDTGFWIRMEHVAAMDFPSTEALPKGEDRVLHAINHKIAKGQDYAQNKHLVVFLDGAEIWYPNKVGRAIAGKHAFTSVYCVGLIKGDDENGYAYSVTQFFDKHSPTYIVQIDPDFTNWTIKQVQ